MIAEFYLNEWRQQAPWVRLGQIEQDLVMSRALVELYSQPIIRDSLVFRGGTCLNKLMLDKPARYSEDLDMVQRNAQPIGGAVDAIRGVLDDWLGIPKRKFTERSVKLIYGYESAEKTTSKLKVEINTTEHYHLQDYIKKPYKVESGWFSGDAVITTYQLNELMGSKLRALYQRRKGRDLFDIWLMLDRGLIAVDEVIMTFLAHCENAKQPITRSIFEKNMFEKAKHEDFRNEVKALIANDTAWDFDQAYTTVMEKVDYRWL